MKNTVADYCYNNTKFSLFLSGRTVLLRLDFLVDSIFLLTLWIDRITVWWLPEFLMSHLLIFYWGCLVSDGLLLFLLSRFFVFLFWKFDYDVSHCGSLSSSYLEFVELSGCLYSCLSLQFESFQLLFFQRFSLPISFSLLPLECLWCLYSSTWWYHTGP